jgi:hypothetical protein
MREVKLLAGGLRPAGWFAPGRARLLTCDLIGYPDRAWPEFARVSTKTVITTNANDASVR